MNAQYENVTFCDYVLIALFLGLLLGKPTRSHNSLRVLNSIDQTAGRLLDSEVMDFSWCKVHLLGSIKLVAVLDQVTQGSPSVVSQIYIGNQVHYIGGHVPVHKLYGTRIV